MSVLCLSRKKNRTTTTTIVANRFIDSVELQSYVTYIICLNCRPQNINSADASNEMVGKPAQTETKYVVQLIQITFILFGLHTVSKSLLLPPMNDITTLFDTKPMFMCLFIPYASHQTPIVDNEFYIFLNHKNTNSIMKLVEDLWSGFLPFQFKTT